MTRLPTFLRLAACGVFAFAVAHVATAQQVYRWVDDKGVVHYADTPPPEKKGVQRVNVRTSGAATLTSEEVAAAAEAEKANPENVNAAKQTEAAAKREQNCKTARTNLLALNSGNEVTGDFDGMRRPLTPEERQAQFEKNQRIVERDCAPEAP